MTTEDFTEKVNLSFEGSDSVFTGEGGGKEKKLHSRPSSMGDR